MHLGIEALKTRRGRAVAFTFACFVAAAWMSDAAAQTPNNSWLGVSNGNWSNGGNWTASTPLPTDTVGLDVAGPPNQPTLDVDPTIAGLLMNATGNNTLNLNGHTLTITGLATQTGGTITGSGTIVVPNLSVGATIAPGIGIGTINVTGNYTQNAGSTYVVDVNASGQSDRINITGTATLNGGTVSVQAANGPYARNTTYTILSATGGRTGTYSAVTSNFAFLTPSLGYTSNAVTLSLLSSANSFQNGAQTPNQRAVGTALDQASPNATGDFNSVLNALYGLDTVQGPRTLQALSGQNYSAFSSLMVQGAQLFMDSFQMQAGAGGGGSYQALKSDSCPPNANACDMEPVWGVWGGGLGAFGTVAGDANANGVTYNL